MGITLCILKIQHQVNLRLVVNSSRQLLAYQEQLMLCYREHLKEPAQLEKLTQARAQVCQQQIKK